VAYSLVQHPKVQVSPGSGSTIPLAFSPSPTAGNLLVVVGSGYASGATFSSISDTIGNAWTQFTGLPFSSVTDNATLSMFWAQNKSTASDTVSLTCSVYNASGGELYLAEFSGWPAGGVQDGSAGTGQGTSTTLSFGNLVTTGPDDLLVGYASFGSTPTIGGSWTQGDTLSGDAWFYRADVAAGTYTASGITQSPSGAYAIVAGALGALAGGPAFTPRRMPLGA
jgi:hypothetical protein